MNSISIVSSKAKIVLAAVVLCLVVLLGIYHDQRTVCGSNDFDTYYFAGKFALTGGNIYTQEIFKTKVSPFLYLPFFAALISPLSLLPIRFAASIWYIFNVFALIGTIYLSLKILNKTNIFFDLSLRARNILNLAALGIVTAIWIDNVSLAQIDFMITFFLILIFFMCFKERYFAAGFILSAMGVIKIYPFYILLYFLAKRKFKVLWGVLAGLIVTLYIVPTLVMGSRDFSVSMKSWVRLRAEPWLKDSGKTINDTSVTRAKFAGLLKPKNQALAAVTARYFIEDDPDVQYIKNEIYKYKIWWPHHLTPIQLDILNKFLTAIMLIITFGSFSYKNRVQGLEEASLEYSAALLSMIMLFPMVKSHTLAPMVLPLMIFGPMQPLVKLGAGRTFRGLFFAALVIYVLQGVEYMQVLGAGFISVLLLWVCVLKLKGN